MIYEDENYTRGKLWELRNTNRCAVCGGKLAVLFDIVAHKAFLTCDTDQSHEGIERRYEPKPWEEEGYGAFNIQTRREMMEKDYGSKSTALAKYQGMVSLTKDEAKEIIRTIWPAAEGASPEEVFKAVTVCTQYGLNPLMRHLFLVPFHNKDTDRDEYVCILGINSNRLIASRKHRWSFLDDTPRVSTVEEEEKHYRKVDPDKIRAITKIRDLESGAEVTAWGEWQVWKYDRNGKKLRNEPKGVDKGNSMENMACVRAERRGLDMLYPADLPSTDIPVADESYGSDIDADYTVLHDETPTDETDEAVEDTGDTAAADTFESERGEGAGSTVAETAEEGKTSKNRRTSAARRGADDITQNDIPDGNALQRVANEIWGIQPDKLWPELNYKSIRNFEEAKFESAWDCFLKLKTVRV